MCFKCDKYGYLHLIAVWHRREEMAVVCELPPLSLFIFFSLCVLSIFLMFFGQPIPCMQVQKVKFEGGAGGVIAATRRPFSSHHRLVVLIPFRNRETQLITFAQVMHAFFDSLGVDYRLVVVEQTDERAFNRGKLLNIGYDLHKSWADYFCLQNVDTLPAQPFVDFSFPFNPRHLIVNFQPANWSFLYDTNIGGCTCISTKDYAKANGYSNDYWGLRLIDWMIG
jgi:beta-1,4-galactosyltransferase 1